MKQTQYDELGRIVARTDPLGATAQYEYDEMGNRSNITDPLGRSIVFVFNEHHLPVAVTDQSGKVWKREYDSSNRLLASQDPLGHRWVYQYDALGRLVRMTDPAGAPHLINYSNDYTVLEHTDSAGHVTRYITDALGRVVQQINPVGGATRYEYNLQGDITRVEFPDGSQYQFKYDGGNLVEMTDAKGNKTHFRFGTCGRLVEKNYASGQVLRYAWSSEPQRLKKVINEKGESYTFHYDPCGRVIREVGFDGREVRFEYDPAGNCVAMINGAGEKTGFVVDAIGRVTEKKLPDGQVVSYSYDVLGYLASAANATCEVTYERDYMGRVIKEVQGDYTVESRYDLAGNRIWARTSSGDEFSLAFDGNRRFARLATGAGHVLVCNRDARGLEMGLSFPGAIQLDQKWDSHDHLVEQLVSRSTAFSSSLSRPSGEGLSAGVLARRTYEYDKSGNVVRIDDGRWGDTRYIYDQRDRPTSAVGKGWKEQFTYESTSNLSSAARDGSHEILEYGPGDRLLRKGHTQYFSDAHGRLIRKVEHVGSGSPREWLLEWDGEDRLKSLTRPDAKVWTYHYDPFGRRVRKEGPDGSTQYHWDGDVIIHQVKKGQGGVTWIFDPHSFKPLSKLEGGEMFPVFCDHLGTPREMADSRGKIVWAANSSVWACLGDTEGGEMVCPIRYQGQWFDEESGLFYNRYRYYDPAAGRYLIQDPIGLRRLVNLYAYTLNPLNWVDPFGLNTPPSLPDRVVLEGHGVTIVHNYGDMAREHANPIHFHVDQPGGETRIKADGTVLPGDPPLSRQAQNLLDEEGAISRLRRAEDRITRVIRDTDATPGGTPFKAGNRGPPC